MSATRATEKQATAGSPSSVGSGAFELATYEVSDVQKGDRTELRDGVLFVNFDDLKVVLLEDDEWFDDVTIDIVRPGDDVRLVHVIDVVEPRIRISDPGSDFPGMLSVPRTVGTGRTNRLSGVAVTEVADAVPGEPTYWREAIQDMGGVGATYSPMSELVNLVITFHPRAERFPEIPPETLENVIGGTAEAG
jgi:glycine reductase